MAQKLILAEGETILPEEKDFRKVNTLFLDLLKNPDSRMSEILEESEPEEYRENLQEPKDLEDPEDPKNLKHLNEPKNRLFTLSDNSSSNFSENLSDDKLHTNISDKSHTNIFDNLSESRSDYNQYVKTNNTTDDYKKSVSSIKEPKQITKQPPKQITKQPPKQITKQPPKQITKQPTKQISKQPNWVNTDFKESIIVKPKAQKTVIVKRLGDIIREKNKKHQKDTPDFMPHINVADRFAVGKPAVGKPVVGKPVVGKPAGDNKSHKSKEHTQEHSKEQTENSIPIAKDILVTELSKPSTNETDRRNELTFQYEILRKLYPDANIPLLNKFSPLSELENEYNIISRKIEMATTIDKSKKAFVMVLLGSELILGKLGLDMAGFTLDQLNNMESYNDILYALGKKYSIMAKAEIEPEVKLGGLLMFSILAHLVSRKLESSGSETIAGIVQQSTKHTFKHLFG